MTFDVDTKSVEAPRDTRHWDCPHKARAARRFRFSIDGENLISVNNIARLFFIFKSPVKFVRR